jgi:tetratricopeptide (TPR) repeat protein
MSIALLMALALPLQTTEDKSEGKTIINATPLVSHDWGDGTFMMSLHPGKKWDSGTAWFFREGKDLKAWKGTYKFFAPPNVDDDLVLLKLALPRQYNGAENWKIDKRYEPKGVLIELPLDDGVVPNLLTLSVTSAFFVDESGDLTIKRGSPSNLLEKLVGGPERRVHTVEFIDIGKTVYFKKMGSYDYGSFDLIKSPPPGFKLRQNSSGSLNSNHQGSPRPRHEELHSIAVELHNKKDYDQAIRYYTEAIAAQPSLTIAYSNRALAYGANGDFDRGIADYSKAIEIDRSDARSYVGRGDLYSKKHDYTEA